MTGDILPALIVFGAFVAVALIDFASRVARSERSATVARNEMWASRYEEQTL